jgi:hypothetical protein
MQYISLLFQYFSRHFLLYLIFKCDHFGLKLKKEILVHLSSLLPLSVTHITSQIYFFHISSMKCDSIHFNIMSDIVWSCWSENREKTFFFCFFCHIFIDWMVLSTNFIIYIVACTSYHNNDLLKWVYFVHKWNESADKYYM